MRKIYLIGGGMGDPKLLTSQALAALETCDEVYAFDRLAELYTSLHRNIKRISYSELLTLLKESKAITIGVLVSGDTGFFSAAKLLKEKLDDGFDISLINGISSLQYLCSKLMISYENIPVVSLHGRNREILGSLAYQRYTFVLTGSGHNASDILKYLVSVGVFDMNVTVGEFLSMEQERILSGTVLELSQVTFDNLSVMLFENDHPAQKDKPLFDEEFLRDKTPMTKQEVRWSSVHYLDIQSDDIIYDIGAGTGSVSIEMSRKAYGGIIYAIEKDETAYQLLNQNKKKFGALNVITALGNAMDHLQHLPIPDKAFIGGSGSQLKEILAYLFQANPDIKIVINAITLETLGSAMTLLKEHNCTIQVSCMNISRNKAVGEYNLMMANNPVYILVAERSKGSEGR